MELYYSILYIFLYVLEIFHKKSSILYQGNRHQLGLSQAKTVCSSHY